jgi:hypothetical protein
MGLQSASVIPPRRATTIPEQSSPLLPNTLVVVIIVIMSRYTNTQNPAVSICNNLLGKEAAYGNAMRENKGLCESAAASLGAGGELEETLLAMAQQMGGSDSSNDIAVFLQAQRDRVKKVAEKHVQNGLTLDRFVASLQTLKQQETAKADEEKKDDDEEATDHGKRLQEIFAQKQQNEKAAPLQQDEHYRDICERMGETLVALPGADDEIEMVGNNSATQRSSLKCMITMQFMQDAVKNSVCGHVYSRDGILDYIQQRKTTRRPCKCPVPGCSNSNVTENQLGEDFFTKNAVKREMRRLQHESAANHSQADHVLFDSENDE